MADWKQYLKPRNPIMHMLAGNNSDVVPAAPICQDVPSLPFQHRRIVEKWAQRLADSGSKRLAVTWDDYLAIRVEVYREIFAHFSPAPSWFVEPVQATRPGLAGAHIERHGETMLFIDRTGREIPMGEMTAASSDEILRGRGVEITWDSTLGFKSFKETGAWEPEPNRVQKFKAGEMYHISGPDDPDALGTGDCFDPESYLPRRAFEDMGVEGRPTPQQILDSGAYDVTRAVLEATGHQQPCIAGCTSPFQNTCYDLGFEGLMESMHLEPELVHQAAQLHMPKPSPRREAAKRSGIGILYMYQMFGGGDLFGPRQFEQFVAPAVQQALDFFHELGFWVVYYPMGNATPHLEPMKALDWDALSLEESRKGYTIDVKQVREVMGPDRVLLGNMDVGLIERGDRKAMLAGARYQITHAARHGNFILSCGTPILPGTPADHVKYFCDLPNRI
jgi:hypothetical protein